MRTIQTFVLTLLVDSEETGVLRGSLHSIANEAEYPFVDAPSLLQVLEDLTVRPETPMDTRLRRGDSRPVRPAHGVQATTSPAAEEVG